MPDIQQIVFDDSFPNRYRQTCQIILRLVEMFLRFCLIFTNETVSPLFLSLIYWKVTISISPKNPRSVGPAVVLSVETIQATVAVFLVYVCNVCNAFCPSVCPSILIIITARWVSVLSYSLGLSITFQTGAAVAYWLERRIRDWNEDFKREFDSPLTHTLSKVRDAQ